MRHIPSYYHLSPQQVENLLFRVNLRCVRSGNVHDSYPSNSKSANIVELDDYEIRNDHDNIISKEISWQEKIPSPFDGIVDAGDEEDCIHPGNSGA